MSLLIKALNKAEEAQAQNAKTEQASSPQASKANAAQAKLKQQKPALDNLPSVDNLVDNADLVLSLSPATSNLNSKLDADEAREMMGDVVSPAYSSASSAPNNASKQAAVNVSAKSAANVFSAKGMAPKQGNQLLAIIAGAALISLLGMGVYYYRLINNTPEPVVLPRLAQAQLPPPPPVGLPQQEVIEPLAAEPVERPSATTMPEKQAIINKLPPIIASNETVIFTPVKAKMTKKPQKATAIADDMNAEDEPIVAADNAENIENQGEVSESPVVVKKSAKSKTLKLNNAIASESASITPSGVSVSKNKTQAQVSPTLMRAYEAYNAGNDADAQKLYKQVLQHDIRNVDALLGLGAIAQRQGRVADANGWFGKVLEVEPRNSMAQAAMLDNNAQSGDINTESHLKNMLDKQPDDANLHAELGNYYAGQNQWPSAQQAYFDAYRLHASANNALNLAVSLDQMGKPKLALPYYQRALDLAQAGSNSIDKAALEARIAAIQ
jgi:tetratricopeptide (TPR) repeat protein